MKYMVKVVDVRGDVVCEYASVTHPREGECLTISYDRYTVSLVTHFLNRYRDGGGGYYSLECVELQVE